MDRTQISGPKSIQDEDVSPNRVDTKEQSYRPTEVAAGDSPYLTQGEAVLYVDTTDGAVTVTLASEDADDGNVVEIYDVGENAGTNAITIETEGSESINPGGKASISVALNGAFVKLRNRAGNWFTDRHAQRDELNTRLLSSDEASISGVDIGTADFVDTGDFFALNSAGAMDQSSSVTSSTYTDLGLIQLKYKENTVVPANASTLFVLHGFADPNGDQIDVRLRDKGNSNTILEQTGITSSQQIELGPTAYSSPTPSSVVTHRLQARNSDGATSVTVSAPLLQWGVDL